MRAGLSFGQHSNVVTGLVLALPSGEPLEGAQVILGDTGYGAVTQVSGQFTIRNAPAGTYTIWVRRVGYQTQYGGTVEVGADTTSALVFTLRPTACLEILQ